MQLVKTGSNSVVHQLASTNFVVYSYGEIQLSGRKDHTMNTRNSVNESQKHHIV